ncbi:hypothetical protein OUZ56_007491 [Daphnia magna]|uniref:Uncharacterized protein n=1 Tax=Daphnia magna TaxID=35525 RepID=A0ABR0AAA6_9CRUS|nr:hypothetical protein OUZ56_007491 [Daphnia magna]
MMEGRGVGEDKTTNERVKSSVILFIFAFGDDMRHCRNIFIVIVSEKNEKMKPQMGRLGTAKTEATRIRSIKTNKKKSLPLRTAKIEKPLPPVFPVSAESPDILLVVIDGRKKIRAEWEEKRARH